MNSLKHFYILFLYALIALAIFPLVQYEYYSYNNLDQHTINSFWKEFRGTYGVFILIMCGAGLLFFNKWHKVIGVISICLGAYYLVRIIKDFG